jgi:predicted transcriptional regulator
MKRGSLPFFEIRQTVGPLEKKVMDIFWKSRKPLTVSDILQKTRTSKKVAYTTIMTIMNNLFKKGLLERKKEGKAYIYSAAYSKDFLSIYCAKKSIDVLIKRIGILSLILIILIPKLAFLRVSLQERLSPNLLYILKMPFWKGLYLALLTGLFLISTLNLVQNLFFMETFRYAYLIFESISNNAENTRLALIAFFDNLPFTELFLAFSLTVINILIFKKARLLNKIINKNRIVIIAK